MLGVCVDINVLSWDKQRQLLLLVKDLDTLEEDQEAGKDEDGTIGEDERVSFPATRYHKGVTAADVSHFRKASGATTDSPANKGDRRPADDPPARQGLKICSYREKIVVEQSLRFESGSESHVCADRVSECYLGSITYKAMDVQVTRLAAPTSDRNQLSTTTVPDPSER